MSAVSRLLLATVLVAWLVVPSPAAVVGRVNDEGGFFSAEAIEKANEKIRQIRREFDKDLLIETVPRVPAELARRYKEQGKQAFFASWAEQRAEMAGVSGIYILISREPGHVQVEMDKATRPKAFTTGDRKQLIDKMTALLREKKYDAALMETTGFVNTTLAANLGKTPSAAAGGGRAVPAEERKPVEERGPAGGPPPDVNRPRTGGLMGLACVAIAAIAVVWIVIAVFRAFTRRRSDGYGQAGPGGQGGGGPGYGGGSGGGGGGMFGSLLTGMFGGAAGSWIYDRFLRGGSSGMGGSPAFGEQPAGRGPTPSSEAGAGDFGGDTGGGADFDLPAEAPDDSGGGSFGGGDFGGGNSGGGDFGGGGDGGGGDF